MTHPLRPRIRALLALLIGASVGCDRPVESRRGNEHRLEPPPIVIPHGVQVCADPDARRDRLFDPVVLPGLMADAAKFWSAGVTVADLDRDGHQDLVLPGSEGIRVMRGDGRGGLVEDLGAIPALDWTRAAGAAAGDYDADGDLDLFVTRYGGSDTLLVNDGTGRFADGTALAGVGGPGDTYMQGAAWADLDLDGDLDLIAAGHGAFDDTGPELIVEGPVTPSRLYENRGDGTFVDRSDRLPFELQDGYTFVPGVVDLDLDGWPDLYFVNDFAGYRHSQAAVWRDDRYEVLGPESGLSPAVSGMGLGVADLNGDGLDDYVIPAWRETGWLLSLPGAGVWVDSAQASGVVPADDQEFGWGVDVADLDHDGQVEVAVAYGFLETAPRVHDTSMANHLFQPDALLRLDPATGGWVDVAAAIGVADHGVGRGLAIADLDEDGWLDLITRDLDGPTRISLSRCGEAAWLRVTLRGPAANPDGVGARVEATAGGVTQRRTVRAGGTSYLSQDPAEAWFGLGDATTADLRVIWPDGATTEASGLSTRQWVEIAESGSR